MEPCQRTPIAIFSRSTSRKEFSPRRRLRRAAIAWRRGSWKTNCAQPEKSGRGVRGCLLSAQPGDTTERDSKNGVFGAATRSVCVSGIGGSAWADSVLRHGHVEWIPAEGERGGGDATGGDCGFGEGDCGGATPIPVRATAV